MLSLKRLGYVLLIVLGICAIFILYNVNENNNKTISIRNNSDIESEWLHSKENFGGEKGPQFYVLGNDKKEIYGDIYRNVCQVLGDLKVSFSNIEKIERKDLDNSDAIFIFCDDVISEYVDLQQLSTFIQAGGKVVLAAGVAEGHQDAYLQPVLGIVEKTIKENYNQFVVEDDFLPLQSEDEMVYDGYNASLWMKVRGNAEIYVKGKEKEVPIVYTYAYGKGETLIMNATMLSDSRMVGILVAGIGELLDDFVYPVLGTECVFLDNFPIVTYVNDAVCMKLYGRMTEAFVRDVVWPVFQGIAVRNEIRYTSSVLSVSGKNDDFPAISESLFNTLGKSALQYEGELVYAAECENANVLCRNNEFINNFQETFPNYNMKSLVMVNGKSISDAIETLGCKVEVVRGKMSAKEPEERMGVWEEYTVFPEATSGNSLKEGNLLTIASTLASHGMISHTFDVNRFITVDENEATWDKDKIQLSEFEKNIFSKTNYLQKLSLSQTRDVMKSYRGLEYEWNRNGNAIEIKADCIIEGQSFWLRTKGEIEKAEGADYEKVAEGYYLVRLKTTKAVLSVE